MTVESSERSVEEEVIWKEKEERRKQRKASRCGKEGWF